MAKVSVHVGHKFSRKHNTRDYQKDKWNRDGHIDYDRSNENITFIDEDLKGVFEREFGEAIERFNEKNKSKHPERVKSLNKYFAENKSKACELIFQFGSEENPPERELSKDEYEMMFRTFLDLFKDKYPSLVVFGAYAHFDETTPHLHLDFLPVAESSRGLERSVSMDGALKSCGFTRGDKYSDRPFIQFCDNVRMYGEASAKVCTGLTPTPCEKDTGKEHVEYWKYKARKAVDDASEELKNIQRDIDHRAKLLSDLTGYEPEDIIEWVEGTLEEEEDY